MRQAAIRWHHHQLLAKSIALKWRNSSIKVPLLGIEQSVLSSSRQALLTPAAHCSVLDYRFWLKAWQRELLFTAPQTYYSLPCATCGGIAHQCICSSQPKAWKAPALACVLRCSGPSCLGVAHGISTCSQLIAPQVMAWVHVPT